MADNFTINIIEETINGSVSEGLACVIPVETISVPTVQETIDATLSEEVIVVPAAEETVNVEFEETLFSRIYDAGGNGGVIFKSVFVWDDMQAWRDNDTWLD